MICDRLKTACQKVAAKGYSVRPGTYGVRWNTKHKRWLPMRHEAKRMSPLGALLVIEQPKPGSYVTVPEGAMLALGVDMLWILDFQITFDRIALDLSGEAAEAAREMITWLAAQSREAPEGGQADGALEGSVGGAP